ncbi:hypothetical protein D3C87_1619230 [compost metagenome]
MFVIWPTLKEGAFASPAVNVIGVEKSISVVLRFQKSSSRVNASFRNVASRPMLLEVVVSHFALGLPNEEAS